MTKLPKEMELEINKRLMLLAANNAVQGSAEMKAQCLTLSTELRDWMREKVNGKLPLAVALVALDYILDRTLEWNSGQAEQMPPPGAPVN